MNNLINKIEAIEALNDEIVKRLGREEVSKDEIGGLAVAVDVVHDLSPAQGKGEWNEERLSNWNQYGMKVVYRCSECGGVSVGEFRFCPNCGVNMEKEEEEEEGMG